MQETACRTCVATVSTNPRFYLKERALDYKEILSDMLQELIKIDIPHAIAEKLPQYICDECTRRLLDAHDFVAQAHDATILLLKQLVNKDPVTTVVPQSSQESQPHMKHRCETSVRVNMEETEIGAESPYTMRRSNFIDVNIKVEDAVETVFPDFLQESQPHMDHCSEPSVGVQLKETEIAAERPDTIESSALIDVKIKLESDTMVLNEPLDSFDDEVLGDRIKLEYNFSDHDSLGDMPVQHIVNITKSEAAPTTIDSSEVIDNMAHMDAAATHLPQSKNLFQCDFCEKTFTKRFNMQSHRRTHTGEKPFKCDLCEKTFRVRANMQGHRRTHTGEKPFKCTMCEKSFRLDTQMRVHLRTHTGENPFKCDLCGKAFRECSRMKIHRRTHTGEKPYKCDVCGKEFGGSNNLKIHRGKHTGVKPFKCDMCQNTFRHRTTMQIHRRTHTEEKPSHFMV